MKALGLLAIGAVAGFVAGLLSALVMDGLMPTEPDFAR